MALTLPAYTPTSWQLTLPGYPVIVNGFRSTAYPDILGSLPSDSRWKLTFENMTSAEALALLLPWRASGGGVWPLAPLPAELAGGVNDTNFRKRLICTTWKIEKEPVKESVKNGRFNLTVELVHELAFDSIYRTDCESIPVPLPADPYITNVSAILLMSGIDGSTTFADSSQHARTVTRVNYNLNIVAETTSEGATLARFNQGSGATNSFLELDNTDGLLSMNGDYTVEMAVKLKTTNLVGLTGSRSESGSNRQFLMNGDGLYGSNNNTVGVYLDGQTGISADNIAPLNTINYISFSKIGNIFRCHVNGSLVFTVTLPGAVTHKFTLIGQSMYQSAFIGDIFRVRITKGVGRYGADPYEVPITYPTT